ncbi:hypothetical protein Tco_0608488 [Tanacetum coccineum]
MANTVFYHLACTAFLSSDFLLLCLLSIELIFVSTKHVLESQAEKPPISLDNVKIDDPNITIEEYIRLEEEKSQRHGRTFNWQTATFEKVKNYKDEDDCFIDFETKIPAIVFHNTITSDTALLCAPSVSPPNKNKIDFRIPLDESDDEDYTVIFDENSFSYKITSVNNLKKDSENDEILNPSPSEPTVDYLDDLDYFNDFKNEFPAIIYNDSLTSKSDLEIKPPVSSEHVSKSETSFSEYNEEEQNVFHFNDLFLFNITHPDDLKSEKDNNDINIIQSSEGNMTLLPVADQRHTWLRYQLEGYTEDIIHRFGSEVEDGVYWRGATDIYESRLEEIVWDLSTFNLQVHSENLKIGRYDVLELNTAYRGFLAWAPRIKYSRIFLSWYGYGVSDLLDTAYQTSLIRRIGLIRYDVLSSSGMVYWGLWVRCIGLLQYGVLYILGTAYRASWAPEKVTGIDLFYLCIIDWGTTNVLHLLAQYPFRHAEGRKSGARLSGGHFIGHLAMHFGLEIPAPAQAPSPLLPAPQPRTMSQRIERIEDEVHDLRRDVVGLLGVVESFTTEQSRVSTWLISCMTQLMDASGLTYQAFDITLVGSSWMPYQRRVRPRTSDASTFTASATNDQPDP